MVNSGELNSNLSQTITNKIKKILSLEEQIAEFQKEIANLKIDSTVSMEKINPNEKAAEEFSKIKKIQQARKLKDPLKLSQHLLENKESTENTIIKIIKDLPFAVQRKLLTREFKLESSLDTFNSNGETPMMWMTMLNDLEAVRLLLENGANPNLAVPERSRQRTGLLPIHQAAQNGNFEMLKLLLNYNADPKSKFIGGNTLGLASCSGNVALVKFLLPYFEDINICMVNERNVPPLQLAVEKDHAKVVELLLQAKADPNIELKGGKGTSLNRAVEKGNFKIVELLLNYGADPNKIHTETKFVPIMFLAQGRKNYKTKYKIAKLLLEKKANVNFQVPEGSQNEGLKNEGRSILLHMCQMDNVKVIELLLQNGADTNLISKRGLSALCFLTAMQYKNNKEIARLLIHYNSNVFFQFKDDKGVILSLLDFALCKNKMDTVALLLNELNYQITFKYKELQQKILKSLENNQLLDRNQQPDSSATHIDNDHKKQKEIEEVFTKQIQELLPLNIASASKPEISLILNLLKKYAVQEELSKHCFLTAYLLIRASQSKKPNRNLPPFLISNIMSFEAECISKQTLNLMQQNYFPESIEKANLVLSGVKKRKYDLLIQYKKHKTENPIFNGPSDESLWEIAKQINQFSDKKYLYI